MASVACYDIKHILTSGTMQHEQIIFCDTSLLFKLTAVVTLDTMEGLRSEAMMSDEMKIFLYRGGNN